VLRATVSVAVVLLALGASLAGLGLARQVLRALM
jgi:hypothetical protein